MTELPSMKLSPILNNHQLLDNNQDVWNDKNTPKETATTIEVAPNLEVQETEEEIGSEPDGEMAMVLGPNDEMSSGFGGLGLEGMVGKDDSLGESSPPLGEGNKGVMSGDKAGEGDENDDDDEGDGDGSNVGAAEIVLGAIFANEKWEDVERYKTISKISVDDAIKWWESRKCNECAFVERKKEYVEWRVMRERLCNELWNDWSGIACDWNLGVGWGEI